MSSGSQEKHQEVRGELTRELRQFNELGASFFRVTAAQIGLAVTDMQVIDLLDLTGPATAGQLSELTGLTTGAITRILDRLEEGGFVHRERDSNDGRKVIVRLESGKDNMRKVRSILDSVGTAWDKAASRYDEEQIVFLLEFLKQGNALSRQELVRLQEAREVPEGERGIFSAPLGEVESGRLVVSIGISRLTLREDDGMAELYQARFKEPGPEVKAKDGVVTIRYPRRFLGLGGRPCTAEVVLSAAIPWQIVIQGGAAEVEADLSHLDLTGLEIKGGLAMAHLELPVPSGVVPIRISEGAGEIDLRRPVGVAACVHLKGWVSELLFDGQTFDRVGNNVRLQSSGFDPAAPYYDIEVANAAVKVTITSG